MSKENITMLSGTSDQAVALAKDSGTLNTGLAA